MSFSCLKQKFPEKVEAATKESDSLIIDLKTID